MTLYDYGAEALAIYKAPNPNDRYQAWLAYIGSYPELLSFCMLDYIEAGLHPKHIGLKKVFQQRHGVEPVKRAYKHLLVVMQETPELTQRLMPHTPLDIDVIIYHGLGNGAGTATHLNNRPTLLFGIEKIAELKWDSPSRLRALFIHEYVHLYHDSIRDDSIEMTFDDSYDDAYYKLYVEGVATFLEHVALSRKDSQPEWYITCIDKEAELKQAFLRTLKEGDDVTPYFGDWHPPLDIPDSAYFMGMQIISMMNESMSIETIMTLPFNKIKSIIDTYFEV
jgi:hypothetical protein